VGFIETKQQAERKSGVEAWSLRLQEHLVELSQGEVAARWPAGDIPFHRIAFFKQAGAIIWWVAAADNPCSRRAAAAAAAAAAGVMDWSCSVQVVALGPSRRQDLDTCPCSSPYTAHHHGGTPASCAPVH
jgi:hypothetical protein